MEDEQNYLNSVSSFLIGVCLKCCVCLYLLGKFDTHQVKTSYYGLESRHMPDYPTMYAMLQQLPTFIVCLVWLQEKSCNLWVSCNFQVLQLVGYRL